MNELRMFLPFLSPLLAILTILSCLPVLIRPAIGAIHSTLASITTTFSLKKKKLEGRYWGHRGPCTHREALKEPGILITQGHLLNGDTNQISCFPGMVRTERT